MKRIFGTLVLLATVLMLGACGKHPVQTTAPTSTTAPTEAPCVGFDYYGSDISQYCTVPRSAYAAPILSLDISDGEVQEYIDMTLRYNPVPILVTDRAAAAGDAVYIYYTGYMDGVAFDGGSNASDDKPYLLTLGSGTFIPGFEDALIGIVPSETSKENPAEITVTFPADYGAASLAGKEAVFRIWMVSILDGYTVLSEPTAQYVTDVLGYETEESDVLSAWRGYVREQLRADAQKYYDNRVRTVILRMLREQAGELAQPQSELDRFFAMYKSEIEYYYAYYAMYGYASSLDSFACEYWGLGEGADWKAYLEWMCKDIVSEYLLIYAVAQNEGIRVTDAEFAERLSSLAAANEITEQQLLAEAGRDYIYNTVIHDKVLAFILENATVDSGTLTVPG